MNVRGRWRDPSDDERCSAWARAFFESAAPLALGSVYVNFLTQDETEVWLSDNTNHFMRVFDATVMPPRLKTSVKLRDEPGWISWSLDGKTAYPSTGDVIDVASKKVVGQLNYENGVAAPLFGWRSNGIVLPMSLSSCCKRLA